MQETEDSVPGRDKLLQGLPMVWSSEDGKPEHIGKVEIGLGSEKNRHGDNFGGDNEQSIHKQKMSGGEQGTAAFFTSREICCSLKFIRLHMYVFACGF